MRFLHLGLGRSNYLCPCTLCLGPNPGNLLRRTGLCSRQSRLLLSTLLLKTSPQHLVLVPVQDLFNLISVDCHGALLG
jgi:hypothetical protein